MGNHIKEQAFQHGRGLGLDRIQNLVILETNPIKFPSLAIKKLRLFSVFVLTHLGQGLAGLFLATQVGQGQEIIGKRSKSPRSTW